jgi:nitrile hydratase accessory protein
MEFDSTISEIREREELPEHADELNFEAPWQARAFSLVLSLYQKGLFEWSEFQSRLIEEVQENNSNSEDKPLESVYYEQWVSALENLLVEKNICEPNEIVERSHEFSTGKRDASEFVEGTDHSHPH